MTSFNEIERLIKKREYDEALAACEEILGDSPDTLPEICRLRSWAFTSQADYRSGINELVQIIDCGKATIGDYHSAAFWSLYDEQYTQARKWFTTVLERGQLEGNDWSTSSAVFYLAYAYMELGDYHQAITTLDGDRSKPSDSRVLLPNAGAITRDELRQEIQRRASPA